MDKFVKELKKIYTQYLFFHNKEEMLFFIMKSVTLKWLSDRHLIELNAEIKVILQKDFTIPAILSLWSGKKRKDITIFPEERLPLSDTMWEVVLEILELPLSFCTNTSDSLAQIYEALLPPVGKQPKGVFYTPRLIANLMTDMLFERKYRKPLKSVKVLDPSCGGGQLLSAVYDKLLVDYFADDLPKGHRLLLENILHGWDTDALSVLICSLVLVFKSDCYVQPRHIQQTDALLFNEDDQRKASFDYIIGNPPYVGHKEINRNYSEKLREQYAPVYSDKADISYCFFVLAQQLLKKSGRLVFLTSRYFMEAHNGTDLRNFITNHFIIETIIDFNGVRPIERVGIDPAIIQLKKDKSTNTCFVTKRINYTTENRHLEIIEDLMIETDRYYKKIFTDQKQLKAKGWRIYDEITSSIIKKIETKSLFYLGDLVESFQGIITGCDKAFIYDAKDDRNNTALAAFSHPWIKNKDIHAYRIDCPSLKVIYPNEVKEIQKYPVLEERFLPYKDILMGRRETKKGTLPWYHIQWGRVLSKFKRIKIVYPYKAAHNRFAIDDKGNLFSADVYGMVLKELLYVHIDECFLMLLLNSQLYTYYFQSYAKKLGSDLYEYYPNTLMRLRIPEINSKALEVFQRDYQLYKKGVMEQNLLSKKFEIWLHEFFELSPEESTTILKETSDARKHV